VKLAIRDRGVIFDATTAPENARSCAFTSCTHLTDSSLIVAFRNATGRDAPDGRLRIVRSEDEGRSWKTLHEGMTVTVDGVVGNLYAGYFTELAPGRLIGAFVWVDRSDPTLSFVNPVTAGVLPMRNLVAESGDGGRTWSPLRLVDLSPHRGASCTGPVLRLAKGVLALPYERWKEYDDAAPGTHSANLKLSFDCGQTWRRVRTVAGDADGRRFYWDQRFAIHPATGLLAVMFWTHDRDAGRDLDNHIAWGSPDGTTWSTPTPTGLPGQHCQPLATGGERLVAVYVHRQDPPSLRAALSEDFGRTWHRENELVFYDSRIGTEPGFQEERRDFEDFWQDMMAWRFGHPRGVLLPDGDLFVAYYAGDEQATSMHWVRLGFDG
jgi:hypothetical protein